MAAVISTIYIGVRLPRMLQDRAIGVARIFRTAYDEPALTGIEVDGGGLVAAAEAFAVVDFSAGLPGVAVAIVEPQRISMRVTKKAGKEHG